MTKTALIERLSGYYPDLNPRNYPGEEGKRRLEAFWARVKREHDEATSREQRERGLFS